MGRNFIIQWDCLFINYVAAKNNQYSSNTEPWSEQTFEALSKGIDTRQDNFLKIKLRIKYSNLRLKRISSNLSY